ncbi:MAG: potassium transporter TrkA [Halanaeroarchaeum sp.]
MPSDLAVPLSQAGRVLGLSALSLGVSAAVAVIYRWYVRELIPAGIAALAGVSAIALYLNTRGALGQIAAGEVGLLAWEAVAFNSAALLLGALLTVVGRRAGDRLAGTAMATAGSRVIEGDVSRVVSGIARLSAVTLPEQIHDVPGHDPVGEAVKESLSGRTLLVPRRTEDLETRLRTRILDDYDVGSVDLEIEPDGTVSYLALGRRVAGLGPSLAPGVAAVAIEADPPNAASAGDIVALYDPGDRSRVATGEIRGVAEDTVTVALDDRDAREVAGGSYRLVTLPGTMSVERAFAGVLRAASETVAAIHIDPDSALVGETIGSLEATVVAVAPDEASILPIPPRSRPLAAGETVYVVADHSTVRRLEGQAAT